MLPVQSLLGIVELEKDPIRYRDFWPLLESWLQDAGGFAMIGMIVWIVHSTLRGPQAVTGVTNRAAVTPTMWAAFVTAVIAYMISISLNWIIQQKDDYSPPNAFVTTQDGITVPVSRELTKMEVWQKWSLTIAGLLAILGILEPFLRDTMRMRWRRIFAIAKLSFKEAVRRKIVWVFLIFLLVFLFPARWWFVQKPEDELKSAIGVAYFAMTALLVLVGGLLAGFSIPGDVKNQTIHTIVTKPVERFELVFGRFLGYLGLLSVALFSFTGLSLLLIFSSNVDPAAADKSMRARLPIYGKLEFRSDKRQNFQGISVGREREYRRYIAGGEGVTNRAIWNFNELPSSLSEGRKSVPCEFQFDIYRTTKGEEGKGVFCSFNCLTWRWDPSRQKEYEDRIRKELGSYPVTVTPDIEDRWKSINDIAEEFGRFELRNVQHFDYHTDTIQLPPGLFKNIEKGLPERETEMSKLGTRLAIVVRCETASQFIGIANWDLYILEAEGSFALNFFKGAIGLWCWLALVLTLAIAASTYLAGVISFLEAILLFVLGFFQEFIASLASGSNAGGGPFESMTRLVRGDNVAAELDKTPTVQVAQYSDVAFRWGLGRILNVIPDVDRFSWSNFIAEGFSIRFEFMFMNLLVLFAYLLPWGLLAYYLMKTREVAA